MKYIYILMLLPLLGACKQKQEPDATKTGQELSTEVLSVSLEFKTDAKLGEGAFWDHRNLELYWVDIESRKLHIYDPETKTNRSFFTPSRIGTVVPQTDTTSVIALEDGIYLINTKFGSIQRLTNTEEDIPTNRFNDGKCDPNGNLWVGSMRMDETIPAASLYRISPAGQATKMLDSITISNGIVWTKDASTMYYIDTPTAKIRAFDYDKKTSQISNGRVAVNVDPKDGFPDGMTIDEHDMLWVGLWNGGAVAQYDPQSGKLLQKINVPAHNVTACAFGGEKLDMLYITTASVDMTEEEKVQYPDAGSLFVVKPGVKGVKSDYFGIE